MSSFLSRLKSNQPTSPSGLISPTKSKSNAPLSPIESILQDSRPLRSDGSDKFFGMHNPSNTCYCNSVLQCLYYSEPFRRHVISFPLQTVEASDVQSSRPKLHLETPGSDTIAGLTPVSPVKSPIDSQYVSSPRSPLLPPTTPTVSAPTSTAGDSKESFDNRKKQIMAVGPHIRMEASHYEQCGMPESLYTGLKDVFEAIIADQWRMGVVVPTKFMEILRQKHEVYRSPQHQDAHEFLNLLLNEVVEQVEKYSKSISPSGDAQKSELQETSVQSGAKTNPSWVHELFEGTLTSETRCLTCETVSRRDEVFLDLSVDLEEHTSVNSCLRKFSQEEMLCEKNKFHCDKCYGLQEAEKRMKIKRLPRILALHLKRFKYVEEVQRLQKLFHRVVFPFHLRLMNTTDDAEDPDRLYELYAIIVHLGSSPFQGHYVSIIKTQDRGWLLFDDELVLPVDAEYVRNFFGGDPRNPACAYVLFYTQTTDEALQKEQNAEDDFDGRGFEQSRDGVLPVNDPASFFPTDAGAEEARFSADGSASRPLSPNTEDARLATTLQNSANGGITIQPRLSQSQEPRPVQNIVSFDTASSDGVLQAQDQTRDPTQAGQDGKQIERPVSRHSAMRTGALSRFRNSSLSLKNKPRLWGKPDRAESKESEEGVVEDSAVPPIPESSKPESEQQTIKSKASRFSLGRKKSMNLLSRKE